jgi:hypothetical protein
MPLQEQKPLACRLLLPRDMDEAIALDLNGKRTPQTPLVREAVMAAHTSRAILGAPDSCLDRNLAIAAC